MKSIEQELWKLCDDLRANSGIVNHEYYKPVLSIIFFKYIYLNFKKAEKKINNSRPIRNGRSLPPCEQDFKSQGAILLPKEAQYKWILDLPNDIASQKIVDKRNNSLNSLGAVLDNAMSIIEEQSEQLRNILYREYSKIDDKFLRRLLELFEREEFKDDEDSLGNVYEYFLGNFGIQSQSEDGIFFTPESVVKLIVNVLDPQSGTVLDPACGSGGMFVQIKNYLDKQNKDCRNLMTFYGHEKNKSIANLCVMNINIHNLGGKVKWGEYANTYYNDPHGLDGKCDYVLANPPFNIKDIRVNEAKEAGRFPFGLPPLKNKGRSFLSGNWVWISYFYSYLNETGKAGFVMPNIVTGGEDKGFRKNIVETKHVELLISCPPKFFKWFKPSFSLWFFNKQKLPENQNKILFIDATNYFTPIKKGSNSWSDWQLKNLYSIFWLYRGDINKYKELIKEYRNELEKFSKKFDLNIEKENYLEIFQNYRETLIQESKEAFKRAGRQKSQVKQFWQEKQQHLEDAILVAREYLWVYSKFGEGEYNDILGLCRAVDIEEIRKENYCLTPSVYVFDEKEEEEDQATFMAKMEDMHKELKDLEKESNDLMEKIQKNMELWKK